MPVDARIPLMGRGVQLPNPIENAMAGQKLQAGQMQNALAMQEYQQMQSPEYQQRKQEKQGMEDNSMQIKFLQDNLGAVVDQPSLDDFNAKMEGIFKKPAPPQFQVYGDGKHIDAIKQNYGITKQQKQVNPEMEAATIEYKRAMAEAMRNRGDIDYIQRTAAAKAAGAASGKMQGENVDAMGELDARLPALYEIADKLGALGQKATYTNAGQARDWTKRQLGINVGEGAVARAEYISTVDNEVLPLLRSTFGAAFTAAEGDRLRATLGNEDMSPPEKDAALKSFIDSKEREVRQLAQRYGTQPANIRPQQMSAQDQQAMQWAQMNPNDPRAQAIMDRLQGAR